MDMISFKQKALTPEWARRLREELGETPEKREKALKEFKQLIKEQKDLHCRMDDIFLLRFIRLKKYDLQKALTLCRNYYRAKHKMRNCGRIPGYRPAEAIGLLRCSGFYIAPYRLPWGPHIGILKLREFDFNKGTFDDLIKLSCFTGELTLELDATQLFGACVIIDMGGITVSDYRHFVSISTLTFFVTNLQDSWPQKIDSIHFINEPLFFSSVMKLLQPLIKSKNKGRLYFHGKDLVSLHKLVPPKCLPEELGGSLGPLDNREFYEYFKEHESFFERINTYGFTKETH